MASKGLQNKQALFLILASLLTHGILYTALATSGGRVGGSSFATAKEAYSCLSSKSYNIYHYDDNPISITEYVARLVEIYLSIDKASLVRVQVGLSGTAHSIQSELSTLATAGDTSKTKSFHFFLTESTIALLRHQNYWISGYSSVERRWNLEVVEKEFRQLSTDERLKYDIESLVNIDNMKVQRTLIPRDNEVEKNYIVVTILVAVKGALNLPKIKSTEDLRRSLRYLNTISSRNTLAVEVLWSPQAEHDTLSGDELLENYPRLREICSEVCMAFVRGGIA